MSSLEVTGGIYIGALPPGCQMVPNRKDSPITPQLSRADLLFLHSWLCCYESPFTSPGEAVKRRADERSAERLRRKIALLLKS
jgi:hypothetical protein